MSNAPLIKIIIFSIIFMLSDSSLFYSFSKSTAVKVQLVFLDIKIGNDKPKRAIIKLFYDEIKRTCENFRALCTGDR